MAICEKNLGPDSPELADSLMNLARLLARAGDQATARPLAERALAITEHAQKGGFDLAGKKYKVKLAFQPGTFQLKLGADKLRPLIAASEVVFVNKEEAERIVDDGTPIDIED